MQQANSSTPSHWTWRIRGSLHFGPVIVGEIGDIKRAIVFNGDVMNSAARLEEHSRGVDGGFHVASCGDVVVHRNHRRFFAVRDLGRLPICGRADGIDVNMEFVTPRFWP